MNKKEISEIRKQFTPERSTIDRICTCYVDGEKNKKFSMKEAFFSLSSEECFKYFEIFKKTLSGTIGSNLLNMDFPLDAELPGNTHDFLLRLRNSKLQDEHLLDAFFDKVIEAYPYGENYYIILIHVNYDVPGKTSDGLDLEDASDTVYEYILCSICPVNLSKAALGYNTETHTIEERIRDWVVDMPMHGFLFPSFNDRSADLHSVLYYTKNPKEAHDNFIERVLGSTVVPTAPVQKEAFQNLIIETLEEDCEFEVVKNIHESIQELIEINKENPDPVILTKEEIKQIFYESGVSDDKMEDFDREYEKTAGNDTPLMANHITSPRKFSIEGPDIVIKVNPQRTDLIQTKVIDGRQCLVIAVDSHLQVNGIDVKLFDIPDDNEEND